MKVQVKAFPTLCDPMDCSLSGFSVHGIFQARVLEWIAISFSRGSSRPRNRTWVSHITGRRFYHLSRQGGPLKKKKKKKAYKVKMYFKPYDKSTSL